MPKRTGVALCCSVFSQKEIPNTVLKWKHFLPSLTNSLWALTMQTQMQSITLLLDCHWKKSLFPFLKTQLTHKWERRGLYCSVTTLFSTMVCNQSPAMVIFRFIAYLSLSLIHNIWTGDKKLNQINLYYPVASQRSNAWTRFTAKSRKNMWVWAIWAWSDYRSFYDFIQSNVTIYCWRPNILTNVTSDNKPYVTSIPFSILQELVA